MIRQKDLQQLATDFYQMQTKLQNIISKSDNLVQNLDSFNEFKKISQDYQLKSQQLIKALAELEQELKYQELKKELKDSN